MSDAIADLTSLLAPLGDLMSAASALDPGTPIPCSEWDVAQLLSHVAGTTTNFAIAAEGGSPDWSRPPDAGSDAAADYRDAAARLATALADTTPESVAQMACAELAVHAWDVAHALGRSTADLPPDAARRGLAFLHNSLTEDARGALFKPEQPAPEDADPFTAIAAFAGRAV